MMQCSTISFSIALLFSSSLLFFIRNILLALCSLSFHASHLTVAVLDSVGTYLVDGAHLGLHLLGGVPAAQPHAPGRAAGGQAGRGLARISWVHPTHVRTVYEVLFFLFRVGSCIAK